MSKPKLKLTGTDGNAFAVLGRAQLAAKAAKMPAEAWEAIKVRAMSGDYDNLLATICEHFDVS